MSNYWGQLFKEVLFVILIVLLAFAGAGAAVGIFFKVLMEFAGG